jgi:hypothetical protein
MTLLLALALVVHGGVHVGFVCSRSWPFEPGPSWLAGLGGVTSPSDGAGAVLAIAAFLGFLAAGLVALGILPARLWRPVVLAAAAASAVLLLLFATPATLPGLAIDAALAWSVGVRGWRPAPVVGRGRSRRPLVP